jgi:hypothetical protein
MATRCLLARPDGRQVKFVEVREIASLPVMARLVRATRDPTVLVRVARRLPGGGP